MLVLTARQQARRCVKKSFYWRGSSALEAGRWSDLLLARRAVGSVGGERVDKLTEQFGKDLAHAFWREMGGLEHAWVENLAHGIAHYVSGKESNHFSLKVRRGISVQDSAVYICNLFLEDLTPNEQKTFAISLGSLPRQDQKQFLDNVLQLSPRGLDFAVQLRRIHLRGCETPIGSERLRAGRTASKDALLYYFNRSTVQVKAIPADAPIQVLELMLGSEKVHRMATVEQLQMRMKGNRICFGLYSRLFETHRPLSYVSVALLEDLARSMDEILGKETADEPSEPRVAIFYSINSCEAALSNLKIGNTLIKSAVGELKTQFPSIQVYSTLSPVLGFRRWFEGASENLIASIVPEESLTQLNSIQRNTGGATTSREGVKETLRVALSQDNWFEDKKLAQALQSPMTFLLAHYITKGTHDAPLGHGKQLERFPPLCPVAGFHLSNGASVYRLNWLADRTKMDQSFGMMVNYRYDVATLSQHSFDFYHTSNPFPVDVDWMSPS